MGYLSKQEGAYLDNHIERRGARVLGSFIDALTWESTLAIIFSWAERRQSRYVCICNAHSLVTAIQDSDFLDIINNADMTTPDGMPVAWCLRRLGFPGQQRINGPDLMWKYCKSAVREGQAIFLYGSTEQILDILQGKLRAVFPALKIAGVYSPPFRELTEEEDQEIVNLMNRSGARVIFVGLGCPKQEKWMAAHRGLVHAVMIGVGAAFDYHAGTIKRAPLWMQNVGLEWLFRLISEPRRLWKRYLVTNSKFIWMSAKEKMNRKDVDLKENKS